MISRVVESSLRIIYLRNNALISTFSEWPVQGVDKECDNAGTDWKSGSEYDSVVKCSKQCKKINPEAKVFEYENDDSGGSQCGCPKTNLQADGTCSLRVRPGRNVYKQGKMVNFLLANLQIYVKI